jgi:hypothetical protein
MKKVKYLLMNLETMMKREKVNSGGSKRYVSLKEMRSGSMIL